MIETGKYNPLDTSNLGESIIRELHTRPCVYFDEIERFFGAGIYAIYYSGDLPYYQHLTDKVPIYVGKAVPLGSRRGMDPDYETTALYTRLRDHANSINSARNLDLRDFHCRYLLLESTWVVLGETALIRKYNPLWNSLIDGFGNHNQGRGRHRGKKSRWDTLHPGREWAFNQEPRTEGELHIIGEIQDRIDIPS